MIEELSARVYNAPGATRYVRHMAQDAPRGVVLALLRPSGSVVGAYEAESGKRANPRKTATLIKELLPDLKVRAPRRRRTSRRPSPAKRSSRHSGARRSSRHGARVARNRRTSRPARLGRKRTSVQAKTKLKRRRSSRRPR